MTHPSSGANAVETNASSTSCSRPVFQYNCFPRATVFRNSLRILYVYNDLVKIHSLSYGQHRLEFLSLRKAQESSSSFSLSGYGFGLDTTHPNLLFTATGPLSPRTTLPVSVSKLKVGANENVNVQLASICYASISEIQPLQMMAMDTDI